MVEVSQYIDGSQVYGSSDDVAAGLRSFMNGKLRSDIKKGGKQKLYADEFCPQVVRNTLQCDTSPKSKICYMAGRLIFE